MHKMGVTGDMQVSMGNGQRYLLRHEKYIENVKKSHLNVAMSYLVVNNNPEI